MLASASRNSWNMSIKRSSSHLKISYLIRVSLARRLSRHLISFSLSLSLSFVPTTPKNNETDEFNIYWNVPTFMCHKYGLHFEEVSEKYGILQNTMDNFRGEEIAILYDPGTFPALLKDSNGKTITLFLYQPCDRVGRINLLKFLICYKH